MNKDEAREHVLKKLDKKNPRKFRYLYLEFDFDYREVDRALQTLRKEAKIKYLKKADGGPGWVKL